MNQTILFHVPPKIIYGKQSIKQLDKLIKNFGSHALIITDQVMVDVGNVEKVTRILENHAISYEIYKDIDREPNSDHVKSALTLCEETESDFVISIGGGSCIDLAKAVSVLAYKNCKRISELNDHLMTTSLAHIAIPTTAGTGSEVTNVTVITDVETDQKVMVQHDCYTPSLAVVDPELTYTCPKSIIAHTGVDAFCHAIESLMSKKVNHFSQKFAWSSVQIILKNIEKAYSEKDNQKFMDQMALASLEAGIAFSNASVTLVHGMSRPLGALFEIPHGLSNAMLLKSVLQFNKSKITHIMAEIGKFIINEHLLEPEEVKDMAYDELAFYKIEEILNKLAIPSLSEWGVNKKEFDEVLDKMVNDALLSGSPQNNPIVPTTDQMKELYLKSF